MTRSRAAGEGDSRNINGTSLGLAIYDPMKNEWLEELVHFPADLELNRSVERFYSAELNELSFTWRAMVAPTAASCFIAARDKC